MKKQVIVQLKKRFSAFIIDYLVIVLYALLLFGFTTLIQSRFNITSEEINPIKGQIIGFVFLTLPVFFYFYFSEKSEKKGTIGKRLMNIYVTNDQITHNKNIFIRNVLKFLPWEIAHIGVHWIVFYSSLDILPPDWVWITLITPQIIVIVYIISIIIYRGESSFYDKIANTKVQINHSPLS